MAFVETVNISGSPWRNSDVLIHRLEDVGVGTPGRKHPMPEANPVLTVAAGDTGELTFPTGTQAASVVVGVIADDNALRYTAQDAGEDGNDITITYVDPAGNDEVLAVVVDGTDIEVSLATDGAGVITSTAALVLAAIEAEAPAAALVAVEDEGASDGTGVVEEAAATNLEDGYATLLGDYMAVGQDPSERWHYVSFKVA